MVVAHTCPVGGVFNISEYLTMPWFALLLGCGLALAWRGAARDPLTPGWWFGVTGTVRGVVFVLLGQALVPVHPQVLVVLQTLGIGQIAVAWLVPLLGGRPRIAVAAATAIWLVSPLVIGATVDRLREGLSEPVATALGWLAAGPDYRAITMVVWMLVGVAVVDILDAPSRSSNSRSSNSRSSDSRSSESRISADPVPASRSSTHRSGSGRLGLETAALVLATAGLHVVGKARLGESFFPYTGSLAETGHNALLACAATWACRWLLAAAESGTTRVGQLLTVVVTTLEPVRSLGRLALTAYVMQLVILAAIVRFVLRGGRDDHWWVMLLTIVVLTLGAFVWERLGWVRPVEAIPRAGLGLVDGWRRRILRRDTPRSTA